MLGVSSEEYQRARGRAPPGKPSGELELEREWGLDTLLVQADALLEEVAELEGGRAAARTVPAGNLERYTPTHAHLDGGLALDQTATLEKEVDCPEQGPNSLQKKPE